MLETQLQLLLQAWPDYVYVKDRQSRFLMANPATAHLIGAGSPKELIGRTDFDFFPRETAQRFFDREQAILAGGPPMISEEESSPDHPDQVWLTTKLPFLDEHGEAQGIMGISRDISERKRAEARIRFQARLLDAVEQAVIATDLRGTITFWNRHAETLYGWRADEVIGRDISAVTPAPESQGAAEEIMTRLAAGQSWSGEFTVRRRDGSSFTAYVTDSPIHDEAGRLVGIVGVSTDITLRKRTDIALRAREEQAQTLAAELKAVLESTTDCVYVIDRNWRFTYLNARALAEISGGRDLVGQNIWEAFPEAAHMPFWEHYHEVMERRVSARFDLFFPPLNNWYDLQVHPSGEGISVFFQNVTGKRAAERSLRETEGMLQAALQAGRMMAWSMDAETGRMVSSANSQDVTGAALETAEDFLLRVHPADRERLRAELRKAIEAGASIDVEFRYAKPDGSEIWLASQARLHSDAGGSRGRLVGLTTDITERKRTDIALRARAEQQNALARFSQLALDDDQPQALAQTACEMVARTLGVELASFLEVAEDGATVRVRAGTGWRPGVVGPTGLPLAPNTLVDHCLSLDDPLIIADLRSEARFTASTILHEHGVVSGLVLKVPVGGRPFGVLSTFSRAARRFSKDDLAFVQAMAYVLSTSTERRLARARMEQAQKTLCEVTRSIPGAVYQFEMDQDGAMRIPFMSEGVETLYGMSPADMVADPARMLNAVAPEDSRRVQESIAQSAANLTPWRCDYRIRAGGRERWIRGQSLPRRVSPRTILWNGILTDITHEKALEDQLRQAQKMEAVGQLTGGIAHDFNNLLTIILGNTEILAEEIADPNLTRLSAVVLEAAERGAELTRGLLAFGRRQALQPEPLDLNEVATGLVKMLRRTIPAQIAIRTELAPGALAAMADRTLLEASILNLAVNARDAMPKGGILTIGTGEVASETGRFARLSVSDTGMGMSPEVQARVFEPFFTTKEVGKGSGLGLPMVYGFVRQSGGSVEIESEVGRGTIVSLLLPLAPEASRRAGQAAPDAPAPVLVRETVLVVEDETDVRRFVTAQLTSLGYAVVAAASGPEALARLRDGGRIALLFTDVVLPGGMSAPQLAEAARRLRPGLRVLFTSGYPEESFAPFGGLSAQVRLLRKPYRKADLADAVRRALEPAPADA